MKNIPPQMDNLNPVKCVQIYGAPIGGIGAGTIGRTYGGDFARFQLLPGLYEHGIVDANLFTVCVRKTDTTLYQQALTVRRSELKGLHNWIMEFSGKKAMYYALYPQSWTVYNLPINNIVLTCHQMSPILPNNYIDSSLPVGLFEWTIENKGSSDVDLSIMFTWQSGSATDRFKLTDVSSMPFTKYVNYNTEISGVLIDQKLKNLPLQYCLAAKKTVLDFDFVKNIKRPFKF